jgi:hypothetical protein
VAELEVLQAALDAVLSHRWGGDTPPSGAHGDHTYYGGCAVCRRDVPAVLAVAGPHIAAAALRLAAEELWDRMDGERLAGTSGRGCCTAPTCSTAACRRRWLPMGETEALGATYDTLVSRELWMLRDELHWPDCLEVAWPEVIGRAPDVIRVRVRDAEAPSWLAGSLVELLFGNDRDGEVRVTGRKPVHVIRDYPGRGPDEDVPDVAGPTDPHSCRSVPVPTTDAETAALAEYLTGAGIPRVTLEEAPDGQ